MFLVSLLNAIGWILSPFSGKPKYGSPIANFKEFYYGAKQEEEYFITITPTPTPAPIPTPAPTQRITPKPTQKSTPVSSPTAVPKPKYSPSVSPKRTVSPTKTPQIVKKEPTKTPTPKPTPPVDPEKEKIKKIRNVAAQFIANSSFARSNAESILIRINEISGNVGQEHSQLLEKLKIIDYPIKYSINGCESKFGEATTTNAGFTINFDKPMIVNSMVFAPIENKTGACTSFTLTVVSEREAMSSRVELPIGVPEVYEYKFPLPLSCVKLIVSDIRSKDNNEKVIMPYFDVMGPGALNRI